MCVCVCVTSISEDLNHQVHSAAWCEEEGEGQEEQEREKGRGQTKMNTTGKRIAANGEIVI